MTAAGVRRAEKPHLRKISGYWRVSRVPLKWNKLSPEVKSRWRRAHAFVERKNREEPRA